MKKILLAALLASASSAAYAQMVPCTDNGVAMVCDPTAFHVSSPGATGQDPTLLNNNTTFTITEVGNHDISSPTRVIFIEPAGAQDATITGITGQMASLVSTTDPLGKFSFGPTSISALGSFNTTTRTFTGPAVTMSAGQDLVKQIGFTGGAASISFTNITTEYAALGLKAPTTFDVFDAIVPVNFTSDSDFLTVNGDFLKGTVISAFALNIDLSNPNHPKLTDFDNSWTTAGFVNTTKVGSVPEPSTWALGIVGFGLVGLLGYKRSLKRPAMSAA